MRGLSQHGLAGICPTLVHHKHSVASIARNREALSLFQQLVLLLVHTCISCSTPSMTVP